MATEMGARAYEFLLSEAEGALSRQSVTIKQAGSRVLLPGQVLGWYLTGVVAKVSGTGDGDAAGASVTFGIDAQIGVYTLTCTAASSHAGTFSVRAPDGTMLANLTVASAYTSTHINLTIPDGSTDWNTSPTVAVISVTVTGKAMPYTLGATDGSQRAFGVLTAGVDASVADQLATAIVRDAEVISAKLVGSSTIALAQLAERGIIAR